MACLNLSNEAFLIAMQHSCNIPDFEGYFQNATLSDLEIEVCEEGAAVGEKRKRGLAMPGHSMVVVAFSSYCKVKLNNWSSSAAVSAENTSADNGAKAVAFLKHTIELPVPPGQTDIAVRLVKCMYQKVPSISDLDHGQLLQLLLLADRFGVAKVQAAVFDVFKDIPEEEMGWDTVTSLLDLPPGCLAVPGCKQALKVAEKKLLQNLGDLEIVWADNKLQDQLLQLPHAVLLRLVQHDQTCVANESTVVYTILRWCEQQPQSYQEGHVQQLKELMQRVRMQHLSQLYINTFMMHSKTVVLCYSLHELAIACLCTDTVSRTALEHTQSTALKQYPAWIASKRPASNKKQVVEWNLPLSQLRDSVTRAFSTLTIQTLRNSPTVIQGHALQLQAEVRLEAAQGATSEDNSTDRLLELGLFLQVTDLPEGAVCSPTCKLVVKAASPGTGFQDASTKPFTRGLWKGLNGRGCKGILSFKSISSWSGLEAALIERGFVHKDSCLHIVAEILKMV